MRDSYAAGTNNGFEQQFYGRENSNNRPSLIITCGPGGALRLTAGV